MGPTQVSGLRAFVFVRAPMHDTPADVVAYLAARGCTRIEAHAGPDGSCRGSGCVEVKAVGK